MLELKNISFSARGESDDVEILRNIDLTIPTGKFIVITGPNGGGKSTLAKVIMGVEQPTEGRIYLDGEEFDLSTAADYGAGAAAYYSWVDTYDGPQLTLHDLDDLSLLGGGIGVTLVSAVPRYADVLYFENCRDTATVSSPASVRAMWWSSPAAPACRSSAAVSSAAARSASAQASAPIFLSAKRISMTAAFSAQISIRSRTRCSAAVRSQTAAENGASTASSSTAAAACSMTGSCSTTASIASVRRDKRQALHAENGRFATQTVRFRVYSMMRGPVRQSAPPRRSSAAL